MSVDLMHNFVHKVPRLTLTIDTGFSSAHCHPVEVERTKVNNTSDSYNIPYLNIFPELPNVYPSRDIKSVSELDVSLASIWKLRRIILVFKSLPVTGPCPEINFAAPMLRAHS
jgi:hypothetical protein